DFRLEAGIAVPRHGNFHRPGLGDHRLGPVTVPGIPAITAGRVVPGIAKMIVQLALQDRDSSKSWDVFSLAGGPVAGAGGGDPGRCGVFPPRSWLLPVAGTG